jgi:hypothetical protein
MQRAGEIDLIRKLANARISTAHQKLIEAAATIRMDPDRTEAAFMARHLIQCTLPHSNPGNVPAWTRRNGNLTLGISPGWDHQRNTSVGYPYGSIPRLLLFWIVTEAVRQGKRRLELGHSLAEFMRAIGLDPNTGRGKRGDARHLRGCSGRSSVFRSATEAFRSSF